MATDSPSMSTLMPVSMGSVSSRLAAGATWPTAEANTPPPMAPMAGGMAGRAGKSSTGMVMRPNSALPQVSTASAPSVTSSTSSAGRLRLISASSLPGMSTRPSSDTSASIAARAETS
ncbi:hypothetical protein GCM10020001_045590 [Nonomuraea salmonea]